MRLFRLLLAQLPWLALLTYMAIAQMPYNPTRLLRNDRLLYLFHPSSLLSSPAQFQLSSVELSSPLIAANLSLKTLYPTLPFLADDHLRAFTPVLESDGTLKVYTGDCAQGVESSQVWSHAPTPSNMSGSSSWTKQGLSVTDSQHANSAVATFLGSGLAFSSIVGASTANVSLYFFGGMCPSQNHTTEEWQSAADYSNLVVALQSSTPANKTTDYQLAILSSRSPPVPEAGFAMTGLLPTFSNRSDGTQTQQQNYVVVGGHTRTAFINMSQVALFSLPEKSWTFVGVEEPDISPVGLAARADARTIDPRSGHTAVLTSDGQKIIIFGGWVADINTPAEPQLVILNVADGYGGKGDWQWLVPVTSGPGLPQDTGLFGHGAIMLPGGVMMISGGQTTGLTESSRKRATPTTNDKTYFFNVTSYTWVTGYSPPPQALLPARPEAGSLSGPARKAGLGLGVAGAVLVGCGLFILYIVRRRRIHRHKADRERVLQDLAASAYRYNIHDGPSGIDDGGDHLDALGDHANTGSYYFPPGAHGGQGRTANNVREVERTGLLVEVPSPTRGLRRSASSRAGYPRGKVNGPGDIPPIDELEEDQDENRANDGTGSSRPLEMVESRTGQEASVLAGHSIIDPFSDHHEDDGNTRHSTSACRLTPHSFRDGESNGSERASTDGSLSSSVILEQRISSLSGRLSPDRACSDRTGSNLSERSSRSNFSWATSNGAVRRSASLRAALMLSGAPSSNPFSTPSPSPTYGRLRGNSDSSLQSPTDRGAQSFTSVHNVGAEEVDSFRSAYSSFAHLQAEGEMLLGGNPERTRPETSSSKSNTCQDAESVDSPTAPAVRAAPYAMNLAASRPNARERRTSWLGSVRRVLTRSTSSAAQTRSLATTILSYEPYADNPTSAVGISANEDRHPFTNTASAPPRRAASDASFWRNRRGKQDWVDEEADSTWRRMAGDDWGAPEDVAMAERERQRQEWRDRGSLLVDLAVNDELPPSHSPIRSNHLGIPTVDDRPCTPASEVDWDVEAAVERRVVQVMFTVPKSRLRVVNADEDHSSTISTQREGPKAADEARSETSSPSGRVKNLAGLFEHMTSAPASPRLRPRPSPSPSIKSMKVRSKASSTSLATRNSGNGVGTSSLSDLGQQVKADIP